MVNPPTYAATEQKQSSVAKIIIGLSCCGGCLFLSIILAAIAVPAFINYIKKSKTAEAEVQLQALAVSVEGAFTQNGQMPGPTGPLPPLPRDERQIGAFASDPTFAALRFDPGPTFFSYSIVPNGPQSVRLLAQGDLDGDGLQSLFEVVVSCEPGRPCIRGGITRTNELE